MRYGLSLSLSHSLRIGFSPFFRFTGSVRGRKGERRGVLMHYKALLVGATIRRGTHNLFLFGILRTAPVVLSNMFDHVLTIVHALLYRLPSVFAACRRGKQPAVTHVPHQLMVPPTVALLTNFQSFFGNDREMIRVQIISGAKIGAVMTRLSSRKYQLSQAHLTYAPIRWDDAREPSFPGFVAMLVSNFHHPPSASICTCPPPVSIASPYPSYGDMAHQ